MGRGIGYVKERTAFHRTLPEKCWLERSTARKGANVDATHDAKAPPLNTLEQFDVTTKVADGELVFVLREQLLLLSPL